jgi:hypothetical protein
MIHTVFWATIAVLGIFYAGCWLQLVGKAKQGKQWLWQTPLWIFHPEDFNHPQAGRLCKVAQTCLILMLAMLAMYFLWPKADF